MENTGHDINLRIETASGGFTSTNEIHTNNYERFQLETPERINSIVCVQRT